MPYGLILFLLITSLLSCKKGEEKSVTGCTPGAATTRQITNKQAVVKVTATVIGVYLVEQGAIDTRLIPCNLPMEFYQNDLQVIISGEVKATPQSVSTPCCTENLVITKITR